MTRSIATLPGSVFIAQWVLLALVGCTSTEEPREGQEGNVRYRLDENTVWLRPGSPITVLDQRPDRLVLSELPSGLEVGKVLVSSAGNGALHKVRSVRRDGSSVVVETEPATLREAFEELEVEINKPLGRTELGDLQSDVPGLSFEWVQEPSIQSRGSGVAPTVEFNTLRVKFDRAELSDEGIDVDGEVFLRLHPVWTLRMKPASGVVPKVELFEAGARPEFHGSVTVSSAYGGSITADRIWFDKPLRAIAWGPLVFVARLKISSAISGIANGSFSSTYSLQSSAVGLVGRNESEGWYTRGSIAPAHKGLVKQAKATLEVQADLLTVEFRYDLYTLGGPYSRASTYAKVTGEFDIGRDNREGVTAKILGGVSLEAGVGTNFQKLMGFDVEQAVVTVDAPLVKVFEDFFPYEGTASIVVADNGPAAEDIFEVALDGVSLGRTQRGGTGQFRATDLRPGRHLLAITCVDDGHAGGDIGTLGIALGDGLTFSNGFNTLSDTLYLYESRTYEVIVPMGLGAESEKPPPLMPRNESPERLP